MGFLRSTGSELKKLTRSRLPYALAAAALLAPAAGMLTHMGINAGNASSIYILAAVKMGALCGVFLFSVYTIFELDRAKRYHVADMLEAFADMRTLYAAKAVAIAIAAAATGTVAGVAYLPYTAARLGGCFDLGVYAASYLGVMSLGMAAGVLCAAGLYLIPRRMDAGIVLFMIAAFVGLNTHNNYLLHWINTNIQVYSDYFGNDAALRVLLWNRVFTLCAALFIFLLGAACTRRYSRRVLYSLLCNLKNGGLALGLCAVLACAALVYCFEPLFDHAKDIEMQLVTDEKSGTTAGIMKLEKTVNSNLALESADLDVRVNAQAGSLEGRARYRVKNSAGSAQKASLFLNPGYRIQSFTINGAPASPRRLGQGSLGGEEYAFELPGDAESTLEIAYAGTVEESRIMQDSFGQAVISRELVALKGDSLSPALQVATDATKSTGRIALPEGLTPVTTGDAARQISSNDRDHTATWEFSCRGASILLVASRYEVEKFRAGGTDIEFYYHRAQRDAVRKLNAPDVIRDAVEYFTGMLGPLGYKDVPLKIIENSAAMLGGNAAGNICNIGESIFNPEGFASSEYEGTNGAEVLAHEICHQWWGVGTRFKQGMPWTPEGLTVFTAYKFLAHRYGLEYAQKTCVDAWRAQVNSLRTNFYYNNPEYYEIVPSAYLFNILGANNGAVMYGEMSMKIYKAEQLLGEEKFAATLAKLYRRNKSELSYEDFLNACKLTKEELSVE